MPTSDSASKATEHIAARWGDALNAGFVAVPVLLLLHQKKLGISTGELTVLLNILAAWWAEKNLPFPSSQTMAQRMGVTVRTVQRHLAELEEKGLIKRLREGAGMGTDVVVMKYDPSGLVTQLKALAKQSHPRPIVTSQKVNPALPAVG